MNLGIFWLQKSLGGIWSCRVAGKKKELWRKRKPNPNFWVRISQQEASIKWCDLFQLRFGQQKPKLITSHDALEPLKRALSASRDVIISGQICGLKLQRVFTLGDGCWLPNILWWCGGLLCEGVGAKKFGMSLETLETKLFGRDIPGICRDIPGAPEKFEEKSLCSIFVP